MTCEKCPALLARIRELEAAYGEALGVAERGLERAEAAEKALGEAIELADERLAHAHQLQADIDGEREWRLQFRRDHAALDSETMMDFLTRLARERDEAVRRASELPGLTATLDELRGNLAEAQAKLAAEARRPLPPDVLANALQDRVHPASGRLLSASPVGARPTAGLREALDAAVDFIATGDFTDDARRHAIAKAEAALAGTEAGERKPACPVCGGDWVDVNDGVTEPGRVADCCNCWHEWWLVGGPKEAP